MRKILFAHHNIEAHERFSLLVLLLLFVCYFAQPFPFLAAWFGFFVSAYSVIANDSIQTIGTFLSSNKNHRWWELWLYISCVFFVTLLYSWLYFDGDVSHQRLLAKGFEYAPKHFEYLQIASPIILLVLTWLRIPVSTSFLVLGGFAGSSTAVGRVLFKTFFGYFIAFTLGLITFLALARLTKKIFVGTASTPWILTQWIVSGILWSVWLQQDLANIAVFLPRTLSVAEFSLFAGFIILELGILLYLKGGRIQVIVTEKSSVTDPRFATIIDAVYAIILYILKLQNKVPMSTTFVFLGLLSGREIAMLIRSTSDKDLVATLRMLSKDFAKAVFGLAISIWVATSVNPNIQIAQIYDELFVQIEQFSDGSSTLHNAS